GGGAGAKGVARYRTGRNECEEVVMGLRDVLKGMQTGRRGAPQPPQPGSSSGGMSPMTMAILGLLAYKAVKSLTGGQAAPAGAPRPTSPPPGGTVTAGIPGGAKPGATPASMPGGLGDLLGGLF